MKSRIRTHKKSTREQTPDFSTAPAQPIFQSRPFVVQSKTAEQSQQQPDLKTALRRAQRYGYDLSKMQPTGVSSATAVQPKREMGQSPESDRANAPQVIQAMPNIRSLFNIFKRSKKQAPAPATPTPVPPTTAKNPTELAGRFNPGDKLYGLRWERPQDAVKDKAGGYANVIDQLNNQFVGTKGVGPKGQENAQKAKEDLRVNSPHNVLPSVWKDNAEYGKESVAAKTPEQKQEGLEFKQWLETHPKYSPTETQVRGEALSSPFRQFDRVKKACKAGIQYSVERGKKVHFILDGIDLETVINKQDYSTKAPEVKVNPVTGDSNQNITASELRYVYRNWDDPLFKNGVEFWQGGEKVDPPWEKDPVSWQRYRRKPLAAHKSVVGSGGLLGELKQENPNLF